MFIFKNKNFNKHNIHLKLNKEIFLNKKFYISFDIKSNRFLLYTYYYKVIWAFNCDFISKYSENNLYSDYFYKYNAFLHNITIFGIFPTTGSYKEFN